MKALTVFYDTGQDWRQMLKVLETSWEQYHDIPLQVVKQDPPDKKSVAYGLDTNTDKLSLWQVHFDQDTIFLDCDMLIKGNLVEGFEEISDIGYTTRRDPSGFPFNAGVIFARHTSYSQEFMAEWVRVNGLLYADTDLRNKWAQVVPGINQPALAKMMAEGWEIDPLPDIYNMCDIRYWKQAKAVHVKSRIRNLMFGQHVRYKSNDEKELYDLFWSHLGGPSPEITRRISRRVLIENTRRRRRIRRKPKK